jgi:integrase
MSLWKRGRIWWAFFEIDGVRHQISTRTPNRRDAERIVEQLKRDAALKRHTLTRLDPALTFGALAARFIAAGESKSHHRDRFTWLLSYLADTPIGQITKASAREYRQARLAATRVSDATVNRDLSVLRHLLYWAVDEGLLEANPLTRLRLVRERPPQRPVLRLDEERRLMAAAPVHLKDLIVVALDTGMRRGELLHQRWEHVDLARRLLAVTHSKTAGGEGREIPLTTRAYTLLDGRAHEAALVFTYHEQPIGTIKTAWKATLRRAGTRHVRFHDLRHTFNTRLLEVGVLQEVRKALMGHSSGASVHARYTHIELPLLRDAIQRLDTWLNTNTHINTNTNGHPQQQEDQYVSSGQHEE